MADKQYGKLGDGELVAAILAGDGDAYETIVSRYKNMVYGVILHILPGDPDGEDIAQETFIDGYFHLTSLRDPHALAPWLYGIAKRKALHHYTRRRQHVDIDELADFLAADPEGDPAASPEAWVLKKETRAAVRRAMDVLSEKNRAVAELFYFENLTVDAIGTRLSLSVGTVKSRLFEARKKLKGALAYMIEQNQKKASQTELTVDFDRAVREKIEQLRFYYALNGGSNEGLQTLLEETASLAESLPESPEKHAALANVYMNYYWNNEHEKKYYNMALEAARKGKNADVLSDAWISKLLDHGSAADTEKYSSWLRMIDEEALPEVRALGGDNACGELYFWRGSANVRLKNLKEATDDFAEAARLCAEDNAYRACALCALKCIEEAEAFTDDPTMGFEAVGETLIKQDGKVIFANQPGFSTQSVLWDMHRLDSLHYYLSCSGRFFYDTNMKVGETCRDRDGVTLTLVSMGAVAETPAGVFLDCMHVHTEEEDRLRTDAWYAKGVGLVKSILADPLRNEEEIYELIEYTVNGGDDYFPFAVGNRWKYRNPALPEYLYQSFDFEVHWTNGNRAILSTHTYVNFRRDFDKSTDLNSEYHLDQGIRLSDDWKLTEAIEAFKMAVRANTNQNAVFAALNGLDVIGRFHEYHGKGWRFCPSSANESYLTEKNGTVSYNACGYTSFGPYRFGSRWAENRIFGAKPFRYLQELLGRVWDDKWIPGYVEEKEISEEEKSVRVTVTEGGIVETAAGCFENTLKITVSAEKKNAGDRYYFGSNYQHTNCGVKEYWFARGIGLVRFDCTWAKELSSSCHLVSYSLPAADDSYLPVQIGNRWEYDEINLRAEGYRAKRIMRINCGVGGNFLMDDNQEFVFQGTEEEYEAFKAGKTK